MKNLILLAVIIFSFSLYASAQEKTLQPREPGNSKPRLFDSYAQKINFSTDETEVLFTAAVGTDVETHFGGSFRFAGRLVSRTVKYNNAIVSLTIRSSNFPGACLILSKITGPDGTVSYTGNIFSKENGDMYELKQENGQYSMTKKNTAEVIME